MISVKLRCAKLDFGDWHRFVKSPAVDASNHNRKWNADTLLGALRDNLRDGLSLKPSEVRREDHALCQSAYFISEASQALYGASKMVTSRYVSNERAIGLKLFSATKAREREFLGETITDWIRIHPEFEVFDKLVSQSSDSEFHCLSILVLYRFDLER